MNTDEMIAMVAPDESDPRIRAALEEVRATIAARYPEAAFCTYRGDDPEGIYLKAFVDVEDLDEVSDLYMDRLIDLQVEGGLPIYVALDWPDERVRQHYRRRAAQTRLDRIPINWP